MSETRSDSYIPVNPKKRGKQPFNFNGVEKEVAEKLEQILNHIFKKSEQANSSRDKQIFQILEEIKRSHYSVPLAEESLKEEEPDDSEKLSAFKQKFNYAIGDNPQVTLINFITIIINTDSSSLKTKLAQLFFSDLTDFQDDAMNLCGNNIGKYIFKKIQELIAESKKKNQDFALLYDNKHVKALAKVLAITRALLDYPSIKNLKNYAELAKTIKKKDKILSLLMQRTLREVYRQRFELSQEKINQILADSQYQIAENVKDAVSVILMQLQEIKHHLEKKSTHSLDKLEDKLKLIEIMEIIEALLTEPSDENIEKYENLIAETEKLSFGKKLKKLLPNLLSPITRLLFEKEIRETFTKAKNTNLRSQILPDKKRIRYKYLRTYLTNRNPTRDEYSDKSTYVYTGTKFLHYYENGKRVETIPVLFDPHLRSAYINPFTNDQPEEERAIRAYHLNKVGMDEVTAGLMDATNYFPSETIYDEKTKMESDETVIWRDFLYVQAFHLVFDEKGELRQDIASVLPGFNEAVNNATRKELTEVILKNDRVINPEYGTFFKDISSQVDEIKNAVNKSQNKALYNLLFDKEDKIRPQEELDKNLNNIRDLIAKMLTPEVEKNKMKYLLMANIVQWLTTQTKMMIDDWAYQKILDASIANNYYAFIKELSDIKNESQALTQFIGDCQKRLQAAANNPNFKAKTLQKQIQQHNDVFRKSFKEAKEKIQQLANLSKDATIRHHCKMILAHISRMRRENPLASLFILAKVLNLTDELIQTPCLDNVKAYRNLINNIDETDDKLSLAMVDTVNYLAKYVDEPLYHQVKTVHGKFIANLEKPEEQNVTNEGFSKLIEKDEFFVGGLSFKTNKPWYARSSQKSAKFAVGEGKKEEGDLDLSPENAFMRFEFFKDQKSYDENIARLTLALSKFNFALPPYLKNCTAAYTANLSYDEMGNIYLDVTHYQFKKGYRHIRGVITSRYQLKNDDFEFQQMKISNDLLGKLTTNKNYEPTDEDSDRSKKQEADFLQGAITHCHAKELKKLAKDFKKQFYLTKEKSYVEIETLSLCRQLLENPGNVSVRKALQKQIDQISYTSDFSKNVVPVINRLINYCEFITVNKTFSDNTSPLVQRTLGELEQYNRLKENLAQSFNVLNPSSGKNDISRIFNHFSAPAKLVDLFACYPVETDEGKMKSWMQLVMPIILNELFTSKGGIREDVYTLLNQNHFLDRLREIKSENQIKLALVHSYISVIVGSNIDLELSNNNESTDFTTQLNTYLVNEGLEPDHQNEKIINDKYIAIINTQFTTRKNNISENESFHKQLFNEQLSDLTSTLKELSKNSFKKIDSLCNSLVNLAKQLDKKEQTMDARMLISAIQKLINKILIHETTDHMNKDMTIQTEISYFKDLANKWKNKYSDYYDPMIKFLDGVLDLTFNFKMIHFKNKLDSTNPNALKKDLSAPEDKPALDLESTRKAAEDVKNNIAEANLDLTTAGKSIDHLDQRLLLLKTLENTAQLYDDVTYLNLSNASSSKSTRITYPNKVQSHLKDYDELKINVDQTFRPFTWKENFSNALSRFANSVKKKLACFRSNAPTNETVPQNDHTSLTGKNTFFKKVVASMDVFKKEITEKNTEIEKRKKRQTDL